MNVGKGVVREEQEKLNNHYKSKNFLRYEYMEYVFYSQNEVLGLGKWNGLIEYTRNDLTTCIQKSFPDKNAEIIRKSIYEKSILVVIIFRKGISIYRIFMAE